MSVSPLTTCVLLFWGRQCYSIFLPLVQLSQRHDPTYPLQAASSSLTTIYNNNSSSSNNNVALKLLHTQSLFSFIRIGKRKCGGGGFDYRRQQLQTFTLAVITIDGEQVCIAEEVGTTDNRLKKITDHNRFLSLITTATMAMYHHQQSHFVGNTTATSNF